MSKSLIGLHSHLTAPTASAPRQAAAFVLRSASRLLARLARRLRAAQLGRRHAPQDPQLEFYAEAGAPEGALYVDGQYVGSLPGVTRL